MELSDLHKQRSVLRFKAQYSDEENHTELQWSMNVLNADSLFQ